MSINNWKKKIYIAKRLTSSLDEYGNEVIVYDKPNQYEFNVQPISSEVDLREFGENSSLRLFSVPILFALDSAAPSWL